MLPAFSVHFKYQRGSKERDHEIDDMAAAMVALEHWSRDLGATWQPSFAKPDGETDRLIRAERLQRFRKNVDEFRAWPRFKRWLRREPDPHSEFSVDEIIEMHTHDRSERRDFESVEAFVAAALDTMAERRDVALNIMGSRTRYFTSISPWGQSAFRQFHCHIGIHRAEDGTLVVGGTLYSPDAYDDENLKNVGREWVRRLEASSAFREWHDAY